MNPIESRNASLDTLSVTIQALHVSGKQMTLAVFRQLPEGQEGDTSDLWGVVNYQIKDSAPLWLVFSDDGILKRRNLVHRLQPRFLDIPKDEWTDPKLEQYAKKIDFAHRQSMESWRTEANREALRDEAEKMQATLNEVRAAFVEVITAEIELHLIDVRLSALPQLYIAV